MRVCVCVCTYMEVNNRKESESMKKIKMQTNPKVLVCCPTQKLNETNVPVVNL